MENEKIKITMKEIMDMYDIEGQDSAPEKGATQEVMNTEVSNFELTIKEAEEKEIKEWEENS